MIESGLGCQCQARGAQLQDRTVVAVSSTDDQAQTELVDCEILIASQAC